MSAEHRTADQLRAEIESERKQLELAMGALREKARRSRQLAWVTVGALTAAALLVGRLRGHRTR